MFGVLEPIGERETEQGLRQFAEIQLNRVVSLDIAAQTVVPHTLSRPETAYTSSVAGSNSNTASFFSIWWVSYNTHQVSTIDL